MPRLTGCAGQGRLRPCTTDRLAALAVPIVLAIAACGSPAASPLTDPVEILQAAATTTLEASSVHVDARLSGSLALSMGDDGPAAEFELDESTITADLDIAAGEARVTFALPGVLGLAGEVILVDDTIYAKTTLTGSEYITLPGGIPGTSPDPSASPDPGFLGAIADFLAQPGLEPVKGPDIECGTATCYQVQVDLTPEELQDLGDAVGGLELPGNLPIPLPDLEGVGAGLTVLVETGTNRLAGLNVAVDGGIGDVAAEARFSDWDEAMSIEAPPADEVQ